MTHPAPTLRVARSLLRAGMGTVGCVDEVGRGALAGPVSVGVVVVDLDVRSAPRGLRDSKLLSAGQRAALVPRLLRWPVASAIGHAGPEVIDQVGIIAALRVAAARAFAELPLAVEGVLLDGNHDWISTPDVDALFPDPRAEAVARLADLSALPERVVTRIGGDRVCAGVAAASVLAKQARDAIMVEAVGQFPGYGWAANKGYAAPEHVAGLRELGPCDWHRLSWSLPGCELDEGRPAGRLSTVSS